MRKVTRTKIPNSLATNSCTWTCELLTEIGKKGTFDKVDDSFKNKYRQEDIKESLAKMYNNHCCYCESIIGKDYATYGRIEHLKPKSIFPQNCYDWNNLHWSCEVCNTSYKGTNWNSVNPILDPCCDIIETHLVLNLTTGMYDEDKSSARGKTTINHTGMNREGLVKARRNKLLELAMNYKEYKNNGNEQRFIDYYNVLKEDLDYPSVYEAFLEEIK